MSKLKYFEIGKVYQQVAGLAAEGIVFDNQDMIFTCHEVMSGSGAAMTMDCTYTGERADDGEGWMVATQRELQDGDFIEVK